MKKKIGVLIIHGVGSQQEGYSIEFQNELKNKLGTNFDSFEFCEILWGHILSNRENRLWESMESAKLQNKRQFPLDWRSTREFLVHNIGDALAYCSGPNTKNGEDHAYDLIHNVVHKTITGLHQNIGEDAPIVIFAHSLGATIISNYIWDRQKYARNKHKNSTTNPGEIPTLSGLITFGSSIPLFSLNYEYPCPINFPGASIMNDSDLYKEIRWLNFVDRDDVLGWPLKAFYQSNKNLNNQQEITLGRIEDYEINVGSILTSWTPFSHEKYWTDKDFIDPAGDYLSKILGLC